MEYRIAVATATREEIDLHFGQADSFAVYHINSKTGDYEFIEDRVVSGQDFLPDESSPNENCSACHESRVEYIAELLADCAYLVVGKIGPKPHRILLRSGVNTLEAPHKTIEETIQKLNEYVNRQKKAGE